MLHPHGEPYGAFHPMATSGIKVANGTGTIEAKCRGRNPESMYCEGSTPSPSTAETVIIFIEHPMCVKRRKLNWLSRIAAIAADCKSALFGVHKFESCLGHSKTKGDEVPRLRFR